MVREVLAEVGLTDLLDEALLLTTELATNGVVHAGTDIDVNVVADDSGVTVTVTDYRSGPIEPTTLTPPDEMAEHGRGLLLVDQFASSWGTSHDASGKGVWFRLDRHGKSAGTAERGAEEPPPVASAEVSEEDVEATARAAERVSWLIHVNDELRQRLTLTQLLSEMLLRLCEVVGAAGGVVWLDGGDGPVALARQGTTGTAPPVRVPLPLTLPDSGHLEVFPDRPAPPYWLSLAALSADRMGLAIETDRIAHTDRRRRNWLTFLAEAGELLAQSLDVDLTLALIPQIMVPRLGEWSAVHVIDEWNELKLAAVLHTDESKLPRLKQLLGGAGAARLAEARSGGAVVPLPPPLEGVVVPLTARGQVLGTLTVGRPVDRTHTPDDITILEDAARRAALAIDNARIHSDRHQIAQAFQQALLPSALPVAEGVGFAAEYVPASTGTDVGGDFYDVVELSGGRFSVSVGDVCGKGAQAAAVTGLVRDVLRVMARDERPLPRTLELLNHTLLEQPEEGRYATLATALAEPDGDDLAVTLYLSGHERPLLLHADGRCDYVGSLGTAVGLLPNLAVNPARLSLRPGDALVFYTDGVTERRHGNQLFGHSGICRALRPLGGYPAKVIATKLRTEVLNFSDEDPRDDMAILVLANET
ncbi:serine phosphatase RsbU (regulator of sigma subunit) [Stackebrandtia albiflava]|uniref:Serine phosphatase RsbU (Regulator of sigma subunit) n=1 Tax=Stackebrandtia albiflava TaxID=406432 RepID=A0A562UYR4_9ACTN|nr:serine phosphatase RsbU (regulator of sigma subunit) [Stackebrandtia albiflava]